MSKFFDFCDKHAKATHITILLVVFVCLFFPIYKGHATGAFLAPYFIAYLFDSRFAGERATDTLPFKNWIKQQGLLDLFGAIFLSVGIAFVLVNLVLVIKRRKPLNLAMLLCFAVHSGLASIITRADTPDFHYSSYYLFEPFSNFYVYVALFALYIIYLLLRRYYAPVKARIQASRAERQANRKPTKDERIAELERKVAELESKNKDEQ